MVSVCAGVLLQEHLKNEPGPEEASFSCVFEGFAISCLRPQHFVDFFGPPCVILKEDLRFAKGTDFQAPNLIIACL